MLGNLETQPGVYDFYRLAGVKERLRYRLFDPGVLPVDISFYGELEEFQNAFEVEGKVNFERRLGRVRLLIDLVRARILLECLRRPGGASGRQEWEANPTLGASYSISPNFSVGVEDWLHREFGATGAGTQPGDPFFTTPLYDYIGPTAMFQLGEFWISAAVYTRVTQWNTPVQQDEIFGRFWFRVDVGMQSVAGAVRVCVADGADVHVADAVNDHDDVNDHEDVNGRVNVSVVVDVNVDGVGNVNGPLQVRSITPHKQSLVSIDTTRSSSSSPRCLVGTSMSLRTESASRTAAHSIADPRAMAKAPATFPCRCVPRLLRC